ncbi:MAG TPA: hypothetical protein VMV47_05730 [Bacteroidales bacterium]|nr:hypothetical protein [Bacteroidales bacterium]
MERTKGKPKLIYEAKGNEHYFPTPYSAYYYGIPDNIVYVIYSSHYEIPSGKVGSEFVIAELEEFSYNYGKETLLAYKDNDLWPLTMKEAVCGWTQKMKIIKTYKMGDTNLTPVSAKTIMNKFFESKTKQ